jgi:hypothetical protein
LVRIAQAQRIARGAIECHQEAVAGGLHLAAAMARQCVAHDRVVALEQVTPGRVSKLRSSLGRADDIREQDRGERSLGLRVMAGTGEKLLDLLDDWRHLADPWPMICALELHEARAGNVLREVPAMRDGGDHVLAAVEDQRRRADRTQNTANVDLGVHPQQRHCSPGTCGHALKAPPPPPRRRIVAPTRQERAEADTGAPALSVNSRHLLDLLPGHTPRIVGPAHHACVGPPEHEVRRAVRIRGGEQHRQRAPLREPEQRGPLEAHGIHYRTDVVHPLLHRRQLSIGHPVGEPSPPLVEVHDAREPVQRRLKTRNPRILSGRLDVADPAAHEHQVDWTGGTDLIGDVHPAALRIANLA